eukprot:TRINITY_DN31777_c0_g1_i1.p1 TRINITY_DN31777_c0_g1~~TRINITY_DN31777_c0_g1_i1.p1  ORF type:complete len:205 (-),score=50.82 TRINITY_DN31777_c0_g1_i1:155-769(-)
MGRILLTMGFIKILILLCVASANTNELLESFIRLDEFGLIYNQSVNLDMETMEVIEHVPQHERDGRLFEDTIIIEDENLGRSVWREGSRKVCYYRKLNPNERPISTMLHSLKNQNLTIAANSTPFIYWWGTVWNDMPEIERKTVTSNVETLCKNMPIMKVVMAEVSEQEYKENVKNAGDCYHHLAGGGGKGKQERVNVARRLAW